MRNPYVTGAFVTGQKHYGREELVDYLLHGESTAYWVIGNRRIGKTSLLRQLEARASSEGRLIPLYWDMQGCDTFVSLGQYLADAIRDQMHRIEPLGLPKSAFAQPDGFKLLGALRRAASRTGVVLLLLCDETEVLIEIARRAPKSMQRLHRDLTAGGSLRVVATSTRAIYQLHDICASWPTSPFLAGFDLSQALGSLTPQSAHALVIQSQSQEQVGAASEVIEAVCDYANNHPYLLQFLCSRLFEEQGRLRPVTPDDLEVDAGLRGFFNIDFRSLTNADREVVWAIHKAGVVAEEELRDAVTEGQADLHQRLHDLERLGYLRRVYGRIAIGNQFLANWLSTEHAGLREVPPAGTSEEAVRTALTGQQAQESSFLTSRLNSRRARLVELEAIRARDLLSVSPQALAEIEQTQGEVRQLRRLLAEVRV